MILSSPCSHLSIDLPGSLKIVAAALVLLVILVLHIVSPILFQTLLTLFFSMTAVRMTTYLAIYAVAVLVSSPANVDILSIISRTLHENRC